jgi:hypothetical protein
VLCELGKPNGTTESEALLSGSVAVLLVAGFDAAGQESWITPTTVPDKTLIGATR